MTIPLIPDHVDKALARRIQQYFEQPNLKGMIEAFVGPMQEIEQVIHDMFTNRILDNAVGEQLDRFGEIVVLERQGFDDDFYRILLKVKIGQNISTGIPKFIISTIRLLTGATQVHYMNHGKGGVGLAINTTIPAEDVDFILKNMEKVIMAGVRLDNLSCYDPDEPFSFDGVGPIGLGFSSLAAPTTGGKLGFLHRSSVAFSFDGDGGDTAGFSSVKDPLIGGVFVGL